MNKITLIELVSVDRYGLNFDVAGVWEGNQFRISLSVECDGREIESESYADDGFDPMSSETSSEFMKMVFDDPLYIKLSEAGYKAWECMPTDC
jgi:hypothetical protein